MIAATQEIALLMEPTRSAELSFSSGCFAGLLQYKATAEGAKMHLTIIMDRTGGEEPEMENDCVY